MLFIAHQLPRGVAGRRRDHARARTRREEKRFEVIQGGVTDVTPDGRNET